MIIKIDVDDGVDAYNATKNAALMVHSCLAKETKPIGFFMLDDMHLKVTQYSRAGNIFIHVSKAERAAA